MSELYTFDKWSKTVPLENCMPSTMESLCYDQIGPHLLHPSTIKAGGWDTLIAGYNPYISDHIKATFELYKMHPERIAAIVGKIKSDDLSSALPRSLIPGDKFAANWLRSDIANAIETITIRLTYLAEHNPPEHLNSLSLELEHRIGRACGFRKELRVFRNGVNYFIVATYANDAARVLRKCGFKRDEVLVLVGGRTTPISDWLKNDRLYQKKTKKARKSAGKCILCGAPMGSVQKLFGITKHKECTEFLGVDYDGIAARSGVRDAASAIPEKDGRSVLRLIGVGFRAVVILGFIVVVAVGIFFGQELSQLSKDFAEDPTRTIANNFVKIGGGKVEMVAKNELGKRYTVREKFTGYLVTIYWDSKQQRPGLVLGDFSKIPGHTNLSAIPK
jgi:hypothetical protein